MSGSILYCETAKKFHGKPVSKRPRAISSATQIKAAPKAHLARRQRPPEKK
jgi:hypothetical protein